MAKGKASYLLLFFLSVVLATALRAFGEGFLSHIPGFKSCSGDDYDKCLGNQAVFRVSLTLTCFFTTMTLLCLCSEDSFHSGYWCLKLPLYVGTLIGTLFIPNDFFSVYVQISKFFAFIFMIFQIVVMIEAAYEVHEYLSKKIAESEDAAELEQNLLSSEERSTTGTTNSATVWKGTYLGISLGCVGATVGGYYYLYANYSGCAIGTAVTTVSVIAAVIMILGSGSHAVSGGVLTPSIISLYVTYLAWEALNSHPDEECNPLASYSDATGSIVANIFLAGLTLTWATWRLSSSANALFNFKDSANDHDSVENGDKERLNNILTGEAEKKEAEPTTAMVENSNSNSNDKEAPCWQFHFIMIFGSFYMTMALTGWGSYDGSNASASPTSSLVSVWVKIAAQWFTIGLYLWTMVAPMVLSSRNFNR